MWCLSLGFQLVDLNSNTEACMQGEGCIDWRGKGGMRGGGG